MSNIPSNHTRHTTSDPLNINDLPHNQYDANQSWGDKLDTKSTRILRIYFQNINGFNATNIYDDWIDTYTVLNNKNIDIYGLVETNIAWNPTLQNRLHAILRHKLGGGGNTIKMTTSSCNEPTLGLYQPGGTCLVAQKKIVGRIGQMGYDPSGLGRWTHITLQGKNGMQVVIITAYRLSQTSQPYGYKTAFNQQYRTMRKQGIRHPKPKSKFGEDLLHQIQEWKKKGEVILMIDANADLNDNEWATFIAKVELFDVMTSKHGYHSPNTYVRGNRTIDYILVSQNILPCVQKCGMLAYNDGILADHRGLWIDIDIPQLFKGGIAPNHERLKITPKCKQKALCVSLRQQTSQAIRDNNLQERLEHLLQDKTLSKEEKIREMNELDGLLTQTMLGCLRNRKQQWPFWWTPELHGYYTLVKIWKLRRNGMALGKNFEPQVLELIKQLPPDLDEYMGKPLASVSSHIRRAQRHLRDIRANSFKKRQEYLLRDNASDVNEAEKTKIRKTKIGQAERQSRIHSKIGHYLKPKNNQTLSHVEVVHPDGSTTKKILKEEMEEALLQHHGKHFSQAEGTPFTRPINQTIFGFNIETEASADFRAGKTSEATFELTNQYEEMYLDTLKPSKQDPDQINTTITVEDVQQGFKIWRESTSTSPSGRILPLYKMWLPVTEAKAQEEGTITGRQFFTMITNLIHISQSLNSPLERWRKVHNLFILKEPNNYKVTRLRALHKIEAELNLVRREIITRRLLQQAERTHYLDDNSYGGRNGRSTNDAVMKKFFTLQTMHLERRNGAMTDCDAKACYDRIVPIVLYLSYSKAGLPHNACIWLCQALTRMQYHISTGQGLSEHYAENSNTRKIYGVGQGATDAPTGWLFVSTLISRIQDDNAQGCTLRDPTNQLTVIWTHVIFVDDTYLIHTLPNPRAQPKDLSSLVTTDLSLWNQGIYTTGGKLEPLKTKYYILEWKFKPSGEPYLDTNITNGQPVTLDAGDGPTTIQRIRPDKEPKQFKSLGTEIPGTLDQQYEVESATKKIKIFHKFLLSCPLSREESWIAYTQYFLPSISYGFVAMSFTQDQCDKFHKQVYSRLLQKLGYQAHTPRAIVFAPRESGGIGLRDFNEIITTRKVCFIIGHIRADTSIGKLFMIMIRWAQLQAGVRNSVLETQEKIPYIESTWITHLQQMLRDIKGKLWVHDNWVLQPQRENDVFLMEYFSTLDYTDRELKLLNYCRLYIQALRLSDIVTTDGTQIQRKYATGNQTIDISKLQWPVQDKPHTPTWKLWENALRKLCRHQFKLKKPLGDWYTSDRTMEHKWTYDRTRRKVIYKQADQFYEYEAMIQRRHMKIQLNAYTIRNGLPAKTIPLTDGVFKNNIGRFSTPTKQSRHQPKRTWNEETTKQGYEAIEPSEPMKKVNMPPSDTLLQLEPTLWVVTDGGVSDSIGYYGWVIATSSTILYEDKGQITGNEEEMDSCRAEAGALLEALLFLHHQIKTSTTMIDHHLHHFCDNITITKRMNSFLHYGEWYTNQTLRPHMDIQLQINETLKELNVQYSSAHVKGHQDRTNTLSSLTWEARLNIRADSLATTAKEEITHSNKSTNPISYPASKINLYIDDNLITKHYPKAILRAHTTGAMRQYLEKKFKWDTQVCDTIDWFSYGRGIKNLTRGQQHWVVKYLHRWLPLLGETHQNQSNHQCPICSNAIETYDHFQQCNQNKVKYTILQRKISKILDKYRVDPYLRSLLRRTISFESNDTSALIKIPGFPVTTYEPLLKEQNKIGWKMIHQGRFGLLWESYQRRYLCSQGWEAPATEPAWIQRIITTILSHHHSRWTHRCDCLHSESDRNKWKDQLLLQRIQGLYGYDEVMLPQDRHCFQRPLAEWNTQSSYEMRSWIEIHEPHIKECVRIAHLQHKDGTSDLRKHGFSSTPHTQTAPSTGRSEANQPTNTIETRITQYFRRIRRAKKMPQSVSTNDDENPHTPVQTVLGKYFKPRSYMKSSDDDDSCDDCDVRDSRKTDTQTEATTDHTINETQYDPSLEERDHNHTTMLLNDVGDGLGRT